MTFANVHGPNSKDSKDMRQKLTELKEEIVKDTIIVVDFNSPSQEQIVDLNNTINHFDLIDVG